MRAGHAQNGRAIDQHEHALVPVFLEMGVGLLCVVLVGFVDDIQNMRVMACFHRDQARALLSEQFVKHGEPNPRGHSARVGIDRQNVACKPVFRGNRQCDKDQPDRPGQTV